MARRSGRGRLSSIEKLPEHADEAVRWALDALQDRQFDQTLILERFNEMLADLDPPCGPISRSAFSRYSLRFANQARRLEEARSMAASMAERFDDMPEGDIGLLLAETVKTLVHDLLLDKMVSGEQPSMAMLRNAAEAVQRLELGRKANQEVAVRAAKDFRAKAAKAVEEAASEQGMSTDTVAAIKARILGVEG